jgi:hypothetical protein
MSPKPRIHGARKKEWGWRKTREAGLEPGGAASKKAECMAKFVTPYHLVVLPLLNLLILIIEPPVNYYLLWEGMLGMNGMKSALGDAYV